MKHFPESIFIVLLVLILLIAVTVYPHFQNIAPTQEKLNELVAGELSYDREISTLSYLTQQEKDGEVFVWYVLQSRIDADYRSYFVAKCKALSGGKYQLKDIFTPQTYAKDILSVVWKTDYVLLVNHPDCRSIVQSDSNGSIIRQIDLSTESYPYLYCNDSPLSVATITRFLDAEGNEIS